MLKKMSGVVIALPTPLLCNEDIDTASWQRLINYAIEEGANGLMVAGTMGEGTALLDEQKLLLVAVAVEYAAGRIPVIATISESSTRRTLVLASKMEKLNADYLVCTAPFYNHFPDANSIFQHFKALTDHVSTPVIFYNAPGRTGNPITVATVKDILRLEKIAGMKDASTDFSSFSELLRFAATERIPGFIMQADESVFDASLMMGADGIVSGSGVAFIKTLVALYHAGQQSNRSEAMRLQQVLSEQRFHLMGHDPGRNWMYTIKAELARRGIITAPYVTRPFATL